MSSTQHLPDPLHTSTKIESTSVAVRFLQDTALFSDLPARDLEQLRRGFVERQFAQGDIIFREGDPGGVLYLVYTGQVRIFINGLSGTETSVILLGSPGDIFGELAVIDGLPRSATAVAMAETTLYTVTREALRSHMKQHPQLALNFMSVLSSKVRRNTLEIESLSSLPVPQRLARKLMELAQDYGQAEADGVFINTTLTQGQLASLIGASRESTNKVLRDFRRRGLIRLENGRIFILDPDTIRAQIVT